MITIEYLASQSLSRCKRWHKDGDWNFLEWAGAMCGEAGETANAAKKIKRIDDQIQNNDNRMFGQDISLEEQRKINLELVAKEAADTILYAIIILSKSSGNPEGVLRDIFNKKSEEYGFPERI